MEWRVLLVLVLTVPHTSACQLENVVFAGPTISTPSNVQGLIPNVSFGCSGRVRRWSGCVQSNPLAINYSIQFQVWRPADGGCFALVGSNSPPSSDSERELDVVAIDGGFCLEFDVPQHKQVEFQPDDVIGYYIGVRTNAQAFLVNTRSNATLYLSHSMGVEYKETFYASYSQCIAIVSVTGGFKLATEITGVPLIRATIDTKDANVTSTDIPSIEIGITTILAVSDIKPTPIVRKKLSTTLADPASSTLIFKAHPDSRATHITTDITHFPSQTKGEATETTLSTDLGATKSVKHRKATESLEFKRDDDTIRKTSDSSSSSVAAITIQPSTAIGRMSSQEYTSVRTSTSEDLARLMLESSNTPSLTESGRKKVGEDGNRDEGGIFLIRKIKYTMVAVGVVLVVLSTILVLTAALCVRNWRRVQSKTTIVNRTSNASDFVYKSPYDWLAICPSRNQHLRPSSSCYHTHWSLIYNSRRDISEFENQTDAQKDPSSTSMTDSHYTNGPPSPSLGGTSDMDLEEASVRPKGIVISNSICSSSEKNFEDIANQVPISRANLSTGTTISNGVTIMTMADKKDPDMQRQESKDETCHIHGTLAHDSSKEEENTARVVPRHPEWGSHSETYSNPALKSCSNKQENEKEKLNATAFCHATPASQGTSKPIFVSESEGYDSGNSSGVSTQCSFGLQVDSITYTKQSKKIKINSTYWSTKQPV